MNTILTNLFYNERDMKKQYNELIDRLAGRVRECDCSGYSMHDKWCSAYTHPVSIGTVLNYMKEKGLIMIDEHECADELIVKWLPFGFTRSLRDIKWENIFDKNAELMGVDRKDLVPEEKRAIKQKYQPESKEAKDLLLFLYELIL